MFYLQYIWAKAAPGNKQEACRRRCAFLSLSLSLPIFPIPLKCWEQQDARTILFHNVSFTVQDCFSPLRGGVRASTSLQKFTLSGESILLMQSLEHFLLWPLLTPVSVPFSIGQRVHVCVLHTTCMENICVCVEARVFPGGARACYKVFLSFHWSRAVFFYLVFPLIPLNNKSF